MHGLQRLRRDLPVPCDHDAKGRYCLNECDRPGRHGGSSGEREHVGDSAGSADWLTRGGPSGGVHPRCAGGANGRCSRPLGKLAAGPVGRPRCPSSLYLPSSGVAPRAAVGGSGRPVAGSCCTRPGLLARRIQNVSCHECLTPQLSRPAAAKRRQAGRLERLVGHHGFAGEVRTTSWSYMVPIFSATHSIPCSFQRFHFEQSKQH